MLVARLADRNGERERVRDGPGVGAREGGWDLSTVVHGFSSTSGRAGD